MPQVSSARTRIARLDTMLPSYIAINNPDANQGLLLDRMPRRGDGKGKEEDRLTQSHGRVPWVA